METNLILTPLALYNAGSQQLYGEDGDDCLVLVSQSMKAQCGRIFDIQGRSI